MGKRKKKLAVLLAAAMAVSMMSGMTAMAAEDASAETVTDVTDTGSIPDAEPTATLDLAQQELSLNVPDIPDTEMPDSPESAGDNDTDSVPDTDGNIPSQDGTEDSNIPDGETVVPDNDDTSGEAAPSTDETDTPDIPPAENPDINEDPAQGTPSDEPDNSPETNVPDTEIPVEPDNWVTINGNTLLEDSDEFISLGEGKGSYQYSDGTLVLKDIVIEIKAPYVSGIHSYGTLIIVLDGNNSITTHGYEGIMVSNGDLTIKGDGSLIISNKGDGYDEDIYYYNGLYVGGDLTIDGADVTSDVYSSGSYAAIYAYGDINIVNGANVTAKSTPMTDDTNHYGIHAYNGKITIKDSNVIASADGTFDLSGDKTQAGIGIYSQAYLYNPDTAKTAGIVIDNSNVHSIGSLASMLVIGRDGTITIDGSTIVSAGDVNIRELMATIDDDPDAAAVQIGAILASGEGPVDLDAIMEKIEELSNDPDALEAYLISLFDSIAKDVNIVRNSELTAQKASLSLSPVPQTGDNAHAEVLLLTMLAAGIVCVYIIRKKAAV